MNLLNILIWLPILGAIPVGLLRAPNKVNQARWLAVIISLIALIISVVLLCQFDPTSFAMQFRDQLPWIPALHLNYDIGVDGISLPLIVLTCFTTLIGVLASFSMVEHKVAQYLAAFLLMQGMVIGVFASIDAILFYFFWEGMLIPMYLSIGIWGIKNRSFAAMKLFIYTFFGSALLLLAFLYLGLNEKTFDITLFAQNLMPHNIQLWLFIAFLLAFAVKLPMWPFHTWLLDATVDAPIGGSVMLSALMVKLGAYGFLRFNLPITPDASHALAWLMIVLAIIAIVYVGFIAIVQTDMKKLIAYSSVSHMGFVVFGCYMLFVIIDRTGSLKDAYMSLEGGFVQMITHAFGAGAMFLAFGVLYQQLKTQDIKHFGGIAKTMPVFAAFFMLFAMSNVGLPGTSGFVGEFMILLSAFKASFWATLFAASILIIGAAYTLWMYKRVFFGQIENNAVAQLRDVRGINTLIFVLLTIPILWIGFDPNPLLNVMHASIGNLLALANR